jgi:hypothetical protein
MTFPFSDRLYRRQSAGAMQSARSSSYTHTFVGAREKTVLRRRERPMREKCNRRMNAFSSVSALSIFYF